MKFEEAYSVYGDRNYTIDEISEIQVKNPRLFVERFQNALFCPECRRPRLSYHNAAPPYFQTYPKAEHAPDCSLRQEEMSPKAADAFVANVENHFLIQRQMQRLLNTLYGKRILVDNIPMSPIQEDEKALVSGRSTTTSKRMPQKRVDISMRLEDYFCMKYFYGRVHLKWESAGNRYKILLFSRDTKRLLCRISVTEKVYANISNLWKTPSEYDCGIAFAEIAYPITSQGVIHEKAVFDETSPNLLKRYFHVYLTHSRHILINKL